MCGRCSAMLQSITSCACATILARVCACHCSCCTLSLSDSPTTQNATMPFELSYGSKIKLCNTAHGGCLLHSHTHRYPQIVNDAHGGLVSSMQQVACLPIDRQHEDDQGTWWVIENPEFGLSPAGATHVHAISHQDVIRLRHLRTRGVLNSHDVASARTPTAQEVSCYHLRDQGTKHDLWRIELVYQSESIVLAGMSQLRLVHVDTNALLRATNLSLRIWANEYGEIVSDVMQEKAFSEFVIVDHYNAQLRKGFSGSYPSLSFVEKFRELHAKMLEGNSKLMVEHPYSSRPQEWPFAQVGVRYFQDNTTHAQVFFVGNPVVWIFAAAGTALFVLTDIFYLLRRQRGFFDVSDEDYARFVDCRNLLLVGYVVHYVPFFFMERTLFVHHYLTASVFGTMIAAFTLHWWATRILKNPAETEESVSEATVSEGAKQSESPQSDIKQQSSSVPSAQTSTAPISSPQGANHSDSAPSRASPSTQRGSGQSAAPNKSYRRIRRVLHFGAQSLMVVIVLAAVAVFVWILPFSVATDLQSPENVLRHRLFASWDVRVQLDEPLS
eukprot:m.469028 g.469028  ORF g.469028 m.469028 type:complete len:555 (+) comp57087_c0_seq18:637-2301(+)